MSQLDMRLYSLDASRGIAAFLVYIFHSNNLENIYISNFWVFVDYFFCLSGFVLADQLKQSSKSWQGFVGFLSDRFIRLTPIASVSVLLMFILNENDNYSINDLVLACLLMQVILRKSYDINLPLWSTSAEVLVNSLTPILIRLFRFTSFTFIGLIFLFFSQNITVLSTFGYNSVVRCLIGFSLGYCTFQLRDTNKILSLLILVTCLTVIPILLSEPIRDQRKLILIDIFFCILILGLRSIEKLFPLGSFMKKLSNFLGVTSYAVYAFQIPFKIIFNSNMFSQFEFFADQWFLVLVAFVRYIFLLAFGYYFTKFFDIPIRRYVMSKAIKMRKN